MKTLKTLVAIALSAAGLGTAVTLGVVANNDQKIESANAAVDGRFSILIHDDSWWNDAYAKIYATYSSAGEIRITPDSDLGTVENDGFSWQDIGGTWYAVLTMEVDTSTFTYDNFNFQRRSPSDGSDWGNSGWVLSPAKVKNQTANTVVIDSSNTFKQDWGNYWKITTYSGLTSYASLTGATKKAYLKSASYSFVPDNPEAPNGYEFVGWYTDKSFTTQWTSSSRATADTTLYAKYAVASAEFDDGDPLTYNSANQQYEGIKYFDAGAKFHIVKTVDGVSTNYAALDSYMSSSVATSDGDDVTVIAAGTYAVYFKSDNTIWIQTADASLEAYMYAGYFLTNVGCDSTGVSLPSGWSTCATRYSTLSNDAKNYIYAFDIENAGETDDIKAMIERYNYACNAHPSLEKFIKNSSGASRTVPSASRNIMPITNDSNTIVIITVISVISLSAVGAFFLLRKKRKEQ